MKEQNDADYTLIQNGGEDPTLLSYQTTVDNLGNPITPGVYYFTLVARNWVGNSTNSTTLQVSIEYRVSETYT